MIKHNTCDTSIYIYIYIYASKKNHAYVLIVFKKTGIILDKCSKYKYLI